MTMVRGHDLCYLVMTIIFMELEGAKRVERNPQSRDRGGGSAILMGSGVDPLNTLV